MKSKIQTIKGHRIAKPKLTGWGVWYLIRYIAAPVVMLLFLMDILLFLIFHYGLNQCYGIVCFM